MKSSPKNKFQAPVLPSNKEYTCLCNAFIEILFGKIFKKGYPGVYDLVNARHENIIHKKIHFGLTSTGLFFNIKKGRLQMTSNFFSTGEAFNANEICWEGSGVIASKFILSAY